MLRIKISRKDLYKHDYNKTEFFDDNQDDNNPNNEMTKEEMQEIIKLLDVVIEKALKKHEEEACENKLREVS